MWQLFTMLAPKKVNEVRIIEQAPIDEKVPLLGISRLDRDHIEIIRLLSKITDHLTKDQYIDFCVHILTYVESHFIEEEEFMDKIYYPGTRIHKLEHMSLANVVKVFLKPYSNGYEQKLEIVKECKQIFKFHVEQHDIPLAKYYNEHKELLHG